jgi:hypothetical protein
MGFLDTQPALLHALNRNTIIDGDTYFMHVGVRHTGWLRLSWLDVFINCQVQ